MRPPDRFASSTARRTTLCAVLVCVLCVSVPAGADETIAPIPEIHDVTSSIRVGGRQALLVKSLEIYGIPGLKLRVSCGRCKRFRGKIDKSHPSPGATLFRGVNWILQPGSAVSIAVFRAGQVGRYLRLGALAGSHSGLVFKASGCLSSLLRVRDCPKGTSLPNIGAPVPQAPPILGSQQPALPMLTPTALLSISMAGYGSGTVSVSGISCTSSCSTSFAVGTVVSLTAQPDSDSVFTGAFAGWSGGCTGHGACAVTIGTDQTVTATFGVLGDIDGNGYVGCADLTILKENYGKSGTEIPGDIDGDGIVGGHDMSIMLSHWNPSPEEAPCPSE